MKRKVALAYSGGLDTACILKVLVERGWEVIAFVADVGQQEDFDEVAERARATGAAEVVIRDLQREFVTDFIFPAIAGNAVYENRYLLGTALARPLIARAQVEMARAAGAVAVSHGATGKGNDQVRFELAYAALAPDLEVIAPWKEREFLERFKGRPDLLAYADEHGIPIEATAEKPYSADENLMHRSYESGMLEDPMAAPPDDLFKLTRSPRRGPDEPARLEIHFKDAMPTRVENLDDGTVHEDPLDLFLYLNDLGGSHGIGRVDMVENRFVGIKSRGVYETPGGTILHVALRDLEGIAMDREVLRLRDSLSPQVHRADLQRLLVQPRDGLHPRRLRQVRGADRRPGAARALQGRHRHPGPRVAQLALRPRAVLDGRRGRLRPGRRARLHPHQRAAAEGAQADPEADARPTRTAGARIPVEPAVGPRRAARRGGPAPDGGARPGARPAAGALGLPGLGGARRDARRRSAS